MALPPCHALFQFYVAPPKRRRPARLSCQLYQRRADVFLGVPFNIASYALLTMMVAQVCDLAPGEFVHTLGDAHLYLNHLDQARLQLTRDPRPLPRMRIRRGAALDEFELEDFELVGYDAVPGHQGPDRGLRSSADDQVTLIAAVARNGVIGNGPEMPWHLPEDFALLQADHDGPRPRHGPADLRVDRAAAAGATDDRGDPEPVLAAPRTWRWRTRSPRRSRWPARRTRSSSAAAAQIYAEAMPWAHRLLITEVFLEPEGDVEFPPIPFDAFIETSRDTREQLAWVAYERPGSS